MKYQELNITSKRSNKRVGRGISAGGGKTAGRGTKGQKSRAGSSRRPGFEGGQNPLIQRLPKLRGFNSHKTRPEVVYTGQLDGLGATVTNQTLADANLVSNPYTVVKLVLKGNISKKISVKLQKATKGAESAVKKAGGIFERVDRNARPKKQNDKKKK